MNAKRAKVKNCERQRQRERERAGSVDKRVRVTEMGVKIGIAIEQADRNTAHTIQKQQKD